MNNYKFISWIGKTMDSRTLAASTLWQQLKNESILPENKKFRKFDVVLLQELLAGDAYHLK